MAFGSTGDICPRRVSELPGWPDVGVRLTTRRGWRDLPRRPGVDPPGVNEPQRRAAFENDPPGYDARGTRGGAGGDPHRLGALGAPDLVSGW